jgi:hypothetical protein
MIQASFCVADADPLDPIWPDAERENKNSVQFHSAAAIPYAGNDRFYFLRFDIHNFQKKADLGLALLKLS